MVVRSFAIFFLLNLLEMFASLCTGKLVSWQSCPLAVLKWEMTFPSRFDYVLMPPVFFLLCFPGRISSEIILPSYPHISAPFWCYHPSLSALLIVLFLPPDSFVGRYFPVPTWSFPLLSGETPLVWSFWNDLRFTKYIYIFLANIDSPFIQRCNLYAWPVLALPSSQWLLKKTNNYWNTYCVRRRIPDLTSNVYELPVRKHYVILSYK